MESAADSRGKNHGNFSRPEMKEPWKRTGKGEGMEAGFLTEEEVHKVRPLWEMVFSEDSKEFTDYYFEQKAEKNLVFTRMDGDRIVSMLHLTPYLTTEMEPVCYIVGVATHASYRRRGLMDSMLKEALKFMREEGQTFTFLMPANPEYYRPYQFAYIYDKPVWRLNESTLPLRYLETAFKYNTGFDLVVKDVGRLSIRVAKNTELATAAFFANRCLKERFDCSMLRSAHYYERLQQELMAQNGTLFFLWQEEKPVGILAFTGENGKYGLQEVLLDASLDAYHLIEVEESKPMIMARILSVEGFLQTLKGRGRFSVCMKVADKILDNNGIYELSCEKNGAGIHCKRSERTEAGCETTIEKLTAFCFGYASMEACFTFCDSNCEQTKAELGKLCPRSRIFINEIV